MAPRTSRSVAQRYAEASKKRRKVAPQRPASPGQMVPPTSRGSDEPTTEAAQTGVAEQTAAGSTPRWRTSMRGAHAARRAPMDFTEHYRYVWQDVRRIALISGALLLALIALTFVIR